MENPLTSQSVLGNSRSFDLNPKSVMEIDALLHCKSKSYNVAAMTDSRVKSERNPAIGSTVDGNLKVCSLKILTNCFQKSFVTEVDSRSSSRELENTPAIGSTVDVDLEVCSLKKLTNCVQKSFVTEDDSRSSSRELETESFKLPDGCKVFPAHERLRNSRKEKPELFSLSITPVGSSGVDTGMESGSFVKSTAATLAIATKCNMNGDAINDSLHNDECMKEEVRMVEVQRVINPSRAESFSSDSGVEEMHAEKTDKIVSYDIAKMDTEDTLRDELRSLEKNSLKCRKAKSLKSNSSLIKAAISSISPPDQSDDSGYDGSPSCPSSSDDEGSSVSNYSEDWTGVCITKHKSTVLSRAAQAIPAPTVVPKKPENHLYGFPQHEFVNVVNVRLVEVLLDGKITELQKKTMQLFYLRQQEYKEQILPDVIYNLMKNPHQKVENEVVEFAKGPSSPTLPTTDKICIDSNKTSGSDVSMEVDDSSHDDKCSIPEQNMTDGDSYKNISSEHTEMEVDENTMLEENAQVKNEIEPSVGRRATLPEDEVDFQPDDIGCSPTKRKLSNVKEKLREYVFKKHKLSTENETVTRSISSATILDETENSQRSASKSKEEDNVTSKEEILHDSNLPLALEVKESSPSNDIANRNEIELESNSGNSMPSMQDDVSFILRSMELTKLTKLGIKLFDLNNYPMPKRLLPPGCPSSIINTKKMRKYTAVKRSKVSSKGNSITKIEKLNLDRKHPILASFGEIYNEKEATYPRRIPTVKRLRNRFRIKFAPSRANHSPSSLSNEPATLTKTRSAKKSSSAARKKRDIVRIPDLIRARRDDADPTSSRIAAWPVWVAYPNVPDVVLLEIYSYVSDVLARSVIVEPDTMLPETEDSMLQYEGVRLFTFIDRILFRNVKNTNKLPLFSKCINNIIDSEDDSFLELAVNHGNGRIIPRICKKIYELEDRFLDKGLKYRFRVKPVRGPIEGVNLPYVETQSVTTIHAGKEGTEGLLKRNFSTITAFFDPSAFTPDTPEHLLSVMKNQCNGKCTNDLLGYEVEIFRGPLTDICVLDGPLTDLLYRLLPDVIFTSQDQESGRSTLIKLLPVNKERQLKELHVDSRLSADEAVLLVELLAIQHSLGVVLQIKKGASIEFLYPNIFPDREDYAAAIFTEVHTTFDNLNVQSEINCSLENFIETSFHRTLIDVHDEIEVPNEKCNHFMTLVNGFVVPHNIVIDCSKASREGIKLQRWYKARHDYCLYDLLCVLVFCTNARFNIPFLAGLILRYINIFHFVQRRHNTGVLMTSWHFKTMMEICVHKLALDVLAHPTEFLAEHDYQLDNFFKLLNIICMFNPCT